MASNETKRTDPIHELFAGIKKIVDFMEVKDAKEALEHETAESKALSEIWINALNKDDNYVTYKRFWDISMFQEILPNVKLKNFTYWMENPYNVPADFRENLLLKGRQAFLDSYEEQNDYYRMINGQPPLNTDESEFIYLSKELREELHVSENVPVHELSTLVQNRYISTAEYIRVLFENPTKRYLNYLGMYKIDIFVARRAKDFEIIRYPLTKSDINPNLLNEFSSLYDNYREYVMTTLYNANLEGLYENYRPFMGLLIKMFVLMQISNKATESITNRNYLDDSVLHTVLSMYDIPSSLLMTQEVRRDLAIHLLQLTREKGTNDVYYDLVKILGYQDVVISKLMLMKGEQFDPSNNYTPNGKIKPYFVQVDLKDQNPYDTITSGRATIYDYHKIIDGDPTWWDLPDTRAILENSSYTIADSKYITIEAVIHQIKYMFESVYFARMILDNKSSTEGFMIEIPELFGTELVSVYDLMVSVIAATCMNNGMTGEFVTEETRLLATAGFNFDLDLESFEEFLNTTRYVDKDKIHNFLENITMRTQADVNRIFSDIMYPMREWLELKVSSAPTREEYIEYESIYRALYTYDITRNSFTNDFKPPIEEICDTYDISDDEMKAYQHFYPHTISGKAITVDEYSESRYQQPFLARNNVVDWYIHIVLDTPYGEDDRGYVYFYDILNSPDLRFLTNPDGTRVFMDYADGEVGWEINVQAVEKALQMLDALDENMLHKACFQVNTPILNSDGDQYIAGEKLPANIRTGLYKEILKSKVLKDMGGLAVPPTTYLDYLYRKNPKLYKLLTSGNRVQTNHEAWLEDVMKIVLALETELDIHMKYFEQSVVGPEQFFKPLVTLIKHFKSTFVNIAKTGLKYVFGDKVDAGGNSNMFKLFDEVDFIIHFVTLANKGFESHFGLYDTEHEAHYHIELNDRSQIIRSGTAGYQTQLRTERMGSIRLVDEAKFFKNGKPIDPSGDPSSWYSGEPGTGRWSEEDDVLMKARAESVRITNNPVDMDGWKDYVQSYTPVE